MIAYDALGGLFAINSGAWDSELGTIHYFAPDTAAWEPMGIGHAAFVEWLMSERLDQFYQESRWPGWDAEVASLGPDQVISVFPPLGFDAPNEGRIPIAARSRRPIPAREQWAFRNEIARQTADLPDGTSLEIRVSD